MCAERRNDRRCLAPVVGNELQAVKIAVKGVGSSSVTKIIVCNILLCKGESTSLHIGICRLYGLCGLLNDLVKEGAVYSAVNIGKTEI